MPRSELEQCRAARLFDQALQLHEAGDDRAGFTLMLEAAEAGDCAAQGGVGYSYDVGRGVRKSLRLAVCWYRKAARGKDACAACNLAILYRDRGQRRLARTWFQKSVSLGEVEAHLQLAQMDLQRRSGKADAIRHLRALLDSNERLVTPAGRQEAEELLSTLLELRALS